jgi:hypothetical protein
MLNLGKKMQHCSACDKGYNKGTDEHVQCPLCLNAAYCSEKCRVMDFQQHACSQILHTDDVTIQQFVPYAWEDTLTEAELSSVPVTDSIYRSTMLVKYDDDMRVSSVIQPPFIIGDDLVAFRDGTNEAARGQEPSGRLLSARTFEIVIEEYGEPSHDARTRIRATGEIPKNMIFSGNKANVAAKKLSAQSIFRGSAPASYLFWLTGEKRFGANTVNLSGLFKVHLKVSGMQPVHTRGGYDITEAAHMQFWKNLSSTLRNRLDARLKLKFPEMSARDRDTLRAIHAFRGGVQVALIFQVVPRTNVAKLLDVEFLVPDYMLKPALSKDEEDAPPLPVPDETIDAYFRCDATDMNQVIGLVMAIENRSALLVGEGLPPNLENAAGILRQYARTLADTGETPKKIPPEVHTAIRQLLESQHEFIGLTIVAHSQSYYRKKFGRGRGNVATVALNSANELVAEMQKLRADKQKAKNKVSKAYYRAQQNRIQKSIDNFEIVANEALSQLQVGSQPYLVIKEALSRVNEARSSMAIGTDDDENVPNLPPYRPQLPPAAATANRIK